MTSINEIAEAHWGWVEENGWHNKTELECLALVTEEVGEAVKECRGKEPTEKLGEELADIVLRVLDLMWEKGMSPEHELALKMAKNRERGTRGRLK